MLDCNVLMFKFFSGLILNTVKMKVQHTEIIANEGPEMYKGS